MTVSDSRLEFDAPELVLGTGQLSLCLPEGLEELDVALVIDIYQLDHPVHPEGHLGWWRVEVDQLPPCLELELTVEDGQLRPALTESTGRWINPVPVASRSWLLLAVLRRRTTNAIVALERVPVFLDATERDAFRNRLDRDWMLPRYATANYLPQRDATVRIVSRNIMPRDAVGELALNARRLFSQNGYAVTLYATDFPLELNDVIRSADRLSSDVAPGDTVLYFHSTFDPNLPALLATRDTRRLAYFHGLTDPRLVQVFDPEMAQNLERGIEQIRFLQGFDVVATNSARNARLLLSHFDDDAGWSPDSIPVIPPALLPSQGEALAEGPGGRRRALLTVGRIKSHKKIEDVLSLFAEYLKLDPEAECWIVGSDQDRPYRDYLTWVEQRQLALPPGKVTWWGSIPQVQLDGLYSTAMAYVSMSEDEGFCLPLFEAMRAGVPVFAYGLDPVVEVMGRAGHYFDRKDMPHIAQAIHDLESQSERRAEVIERQSHRAAALARQMDGTAFLDLLVPGASATRSARSRQPAGQRSD